MSIHKSRKGKGRFEVKRNSHSRMSDESLESDETSIYNIIGFKEKEGEEKEEGNSEFKGGRRAIWGLPLPSESDKDSKEETFETPEKEIRKLGGQKGI